MTRRKFTGILIVTTVGVVAGLLALIFRGFEYTVEKFIKEDLKHLILSQQEIDKYISDGRKMKIWNKYTFAKIQFIKAHSYISNKHFQLPYFEKYIQYRSEIVGNFLLSTDFFLNKMNEDNAIHYRMVYNPYITPCANPFSNLYYN